MKISKIQTALKGKSIHSSDPRKADIVQAFKTSTGCTKVTLLVEVTGRPGVYSANCIRPGRAFEGAGFYELVTAQAAPAPATKPTKSDELAFVYAEQWEKDGARQVLALDFGLVDDRGRAVGCDASFWIEGTNFRSSVQSTRDGRKFGAIAPTKRHLPGTTLDEVKADLLARAQQSHKRQAKQFPAPVKAKLVEIVPVAKAAPKAPKATSSKPAACPRTTDLAYRLLNGSCTTCGAFHEEAAVVKSSSKTHRANHNDAVYANELSPVEAAVVAYVTEKGSATIKELAAALVGGDYLKIKNAVRRPRWSGLIRFGSKRGQYVAA